jgi:hypothetical protein
MTRAEWTPKSLSAGKASAGIVKRMSQTNSNVIGFMENLLSRLVGEWL